uniref:GlcG protein n=1 Tax=Aplanochytrium stocchinoi TaxID=215587 RepID=A0A6S7ZBZ5_9STRA|mmetsp:Transcript_6101/g.7697  ORF Transcript_6101/g.7697 Transcript_6101/m.7697 type:complete len:155 (-) Transcript_6101:322-786(-)
MSLTLKQASTICDRALEVGHLNKLNPLTVAVFDVGGNLICFKKEDGSSLFRQQIASGKALAALGLGMDSAKLLKIAADRPAFMNAAYVASGGRAIPVPGGVLIRDHSNKIVGAVGISGDLSEKDEACAVAGIRTAGLMCDAIKEGRECYIKAHL